MTPDAALWCHFSPSTFDPVANGTVAAVESVADKVKNGVEGFASKVGHAGDFLVTHSPVSLIRGMLAVDQ